jgi:predicted transposase YdaD
LGDPQQYRFESVEIKEPSFRIDGVFLPPEDDPNRTIFFAEVQFQKDNALHHRFFAESHLYLYRNPIYLRGCLKRCIDSYTRPLNPPSLGDFEFRNGLKSPKLGDLGGGSA